MADVTYTELHYLNRKQCRAVIAAALIESKTVAVESVFFGDQAAAAQAPSVQKLKSAVDVIMANVVESMG